MTARVPARLVAGGVLGAALVLAAAGQAGAVDLTDPTVTTEDGMQVMRLLGHETQGKFIPKGGEPTDHPTGEPRPGDGFSFLEELHQDKALVGTDTGLCTILPGAAHVARCEVTVTFPKGTMTVVGEGAEEQKESTYKLTGGTGAYAGVSGIVKATELSDTDSRLTFLFKTPAEAGPAKAGAPVAEPKITAVGSKQVIHLIAEQTDTKYIPKGGKPTADFPDEKSGGPKPGDAFAFTEDLKQDGVRVGTDKGGCTFSAPKDPLHCAVTLSFPAGDIGVEGEVVDGQANTLKLTSGTGAYAGIAGSVTVVDIDDDHTDLTLAFGTDAAQVAVVPVGGAATGGGSAAEASGRGLVGLGAFAAAAGAGLLGFGRRTGRRAG